MKAIQIENKIYNINQLIKCVHEDGSTYIDMSDDRYYIEDENAFVWIAFMHFLSQENGIPLLSVDKIIESLDEVPATRETEIPDLPSFNFDDIEPLNVPPNVHGKVYTALRDRLGLKTLKEIAEVSPTLLLKTKGIGTHSVEEIAKQLKNKGASPYKWVKHPYVRGYFESGTTTTSSLSSGEGLS